jgi:hypothetical protein
VKIDTNEPTVVTAAKVDGRVTFTTAELQGLTRVKVSIVIPTIKGREDLFEQTLAAYKKSKPKTVDFEFIKPMGYSTIGEAWGAGATKATGQFTHLTADDVSPHDGWLDAAINATNRGEWPCPRIENPDGSLHSCGTLGSGCLLNECPDGTDCAASPFPFYRTERYVQIGPIPPLHYYADDYLGWKARSAGLTPKVCRDYCLTHHEGKGGRKAVVARAMADRQQFLDLIVGGFV